MGISLSILSVGPRIAKKDGKLVARTSLWVGLFSLGLSWRRVIVDPKHKKVTIRRRLFWFWKRERAIPFRWIESIRYGYNDLSGNSSWPMAVGQTFDIFKVSLHLSDAEIVPLFTFFGEGDFVNNSIMPDWWYWPEYATSLTGAQEQGSRLYVDLLQRLTGKPLSA